MGDARPSTPSPTNPFPSQYTHLPPSDLRYEGKWVRPSSTVCIGLQPTHARKHVWTDVREWQLYSSSKDTFFKEVKVRIQPNVTYVKRL